MASFKAKLLINGEERTILNVQQSFNQVSDVTGRPEGKPYGDALFLSLESTIDDSFFYHYMFDHSQTISGEIIFYKRDGFSILYKIEFANAYILGLEESFDAHSDMPLHFNLKIGWGVSKINGIVHEEDWNPYNPFEEPGEITTIENTNPEILEAYFTDLRGNRIPDNTLRRGNTVFFIIKSVNASGKDLAIDLDNNTLDFIYNNEVLEEDILYVNITADTMRLELKTIVEQN